MKIFYITIILISITLSGCICEYNEDCGNLFKIKEKKISEMQKNIDKDNSDIHIRNSPIFAPIGIPLSILHGKNRKIDIKDEKYIDKCHINCVDNKNINRSAEFDLESSNIYG